VKSSATYSDVQPLTGTHLDSRAFGFSTSPPTVQQPLGFTLSTKAKSADDLLALGVILRPVREPSLFKDPKAFGY
jgi:hypothetical protein